MNTHHIEDSWKLNFLSFLTKCIDERASITKIVEHVETIIATHDAELKEAFKKQILATKVRPFDKQWAIAHFNQVLALFSPEKE